MILLSFGLRENSSRSLSIGLDKCIGLEFPKGLSLLLEGQLHVSERRGIMNAERGRSTDIFSLDLT